MCGSKASSARRAPIGSTASRLWDGLFERNGRHLRLTYEISRDRSAHRRSRLGSSRARAWSLPPSTTRSYSMVSPTGYSRATRSTFRRGHHVGVPSLCRPAPRRRHELALQQHRRPPRRVAALRPCLRRDVRIRSDVVREYYYVAGNDTVPYNAGKTPATSRISTSSRHSRRRAGSISTRPCRSYRGTTTTSTSGRRRGSSS